LSVIVPKLTNQERRDNNDFRLPVWCKVDLRCSGVLFSVEGQFVTEVSGQIIGPINREDVTDNLSRNVHSTLRKSQKSADLTSYADL
jgi:hypothetical protein